MQQHIVGLILLIGATAAAAEPFSIERWEDDREKLTGVVDRFIDEVRTCEADMAAIQQQLSDRAEQIDDLHRTSMRLFTQAIPKAFYFAGQECSTDALQRIEDFIRDRLYYTSKMLALPAARSRSAGLGSESEPGTGVASAQQIVTDDGTLIELNDGTILKLRGQQ